MNTRKSPVKKLRQYLSNPAISIRDRSFMLFSCLVLIALYAAVPFGIVMCEPLSATVSTLIGAVVFTVYVYFVFRTNR